MLSANRLAVSVVLAALALTACQCGGEVRVTPADVTLSVGQTQQFNANDDGSRAAVEWTVQEGEIGGTITSTGVYTAPSTPGTYHVLATDIQDRDLQGVALVAVVPGPAINVAVTPSFIEIGAGQTQQFSTTVVGTSNTGVTWTVQEGSAGGSITAGGFYTASATPGTYHVVATSAADVTKRAIAEVQVVPVSVTLAPAVALVEIGSVQTFAATVGGAANTQVTWTVQEGPTGGSVSSNGDYTPPSTPGTYHVVATSVADPSKSGTATATVIHPVTVSIVPASADLQMQQTLTFRARVNGSTNQNVTWSIREGSLGGTLTADGVYTAPFVGSAQVFHIVASPQANPVKTSEAIVTVYPGVGIQVTPAVITLKPGAVQQFTAIVTGSNDPTVTWSVQEGSRAGTVTASGRYTAPASSGSFHVVATSRADSSKRAAATVIVLGNPVTVSGTVRYPGATGGRVYVTLAATDGSYGVVGTSVTLGSNGTAPFSIRGMQQRGTFSVRAFLDVARSGMYHPATDPFGSVEVEVTDAALKVGEILLDKRSLTETILDAATWSAPKLVRVVPGDETAVVIYEPARDGRGNDACPSYEIFVSATPGAGSGNKLSSVTVAANAPRAVVIRGLTNTQRRYFAVRCDGLYGLQGGSSEIGPVTIGARTGGLALSGYVNTGAVALTNAPLYVMALGASDAAVTRVANPMTWQDWSIAGLNGGTYKVYVFRDVGGDGVLGPTDPNTFFDPVTVTMTANQTAGAIELPSTNVVTQIQTHHESGPSSDTFSLTLKLRPNVRRPVKVELVAGPKIALPMDLPLDETGGARHYVELPLGTISPSVDDNYSFKVSYDDGGTETVQSAVQAVLPGFVMTSPASVASDSPTFTWLPLSPAPATGYVTTFRLLSWTYVVLGDGATVLGTVFDMPSTTTSLHMVDIRPNDPTLSNPRLYWYDLKAIDRQGNTTTRIGNFATAP